MIIAGERRWRAAMELKLAEIPCVVRKYDESKVIEIALIENLQREDLNVIDEAMAYKHIIDEYHTTQEQLSEALGKSRPYISNTLRLLQLDKGVIDLIREGRLSSGHARPLLRLADHKKQYELALKIIENRLSVRQVEELIAGLLTPKEVVEVKEKKKDVIIADIEESLKKLFGTKVTITNGNNKGKILIEYYSAEDMERILELFEKIN
jgi:ParB family chromosome partitioning protein